MDPRHPEEAIDRIDQLITQFKYTLDNMRIAAVSSQLAKFEREGGLVVQEICLVAPRLHEAMMQVSRQRRHDLSHGVIVDMSKYEVPAGATGEEEGVVVGPTDQIIAINEATTEEAEVVEKPVGKPVHIEKLVETELDKEVNEVLKPLEEPKKKTTRKKKTAKKADK